MKIDLLHNKIVKDTVTDAFKNSLESQLIPALCEKYSDEPLAVQMYEDYLSDGFLQGGRFYYPLTVVLADGARREWISWSVDGKKRFLSRIPFSYIADEPLSFEIEESVSDELVSRLSDRGIYFEGGYAPFTVEYDAPDKTFLSGKYSQRFVDEINRQISDKIEAEFSVSGIDGGGLSLKMVFAPGTFMEHVVKETTYRRLLVTARGCSARDLWIKWKRRGSATPVTVSENIPEEELLFEICDDVPQKIREKEYRYLASVSADEYQAAMRRKRITEWRDLVKRVIKRGELKRLEGVAEEKTTESVVDVKEEISVQTPEFTAPEGDIIARLQETLTAPGAPETEPVSDEAVNDNSDIAAMLKNLLGVKEEEVEPTAKEDDEPPFDVAESVTVTGDSFDSFETEEASEDTDTPDDDGAEPSFAEAVEEPRLDEDELRRRIEAELRASLEAEAKQRADIEALELRRAHEALKAENERLAELARKAEEEKAAREAESIAEAERLRREIEARERAEAIEKERMAEAARLALLENQRLEAAREAEAKRREEEEKEAARLAEAARIEEEKRLEKERIEAELRAKAEAEKRVREEAAANEAPAYNYVSKNARLLFRRPVDPNITKRIYEIILTTIKYFKKENVYIKVKATVPDSTTVNLHFVKIPEEETELLINIIKVLGKSELGIIKAILE